MNSNINNGNVFKTERTEDVTAILDPHETAGESEATPASPQDPTQTRVTRADVLKTVAVNKKPVVLLGAGLAAAVALFAVTTFVGNTPHKKVASSSPNVLKADVSEKPKGSVTPLMDTVRNSVSSNTGGQLTPADISRTKAITGTQPAPLPSSSSSSRSASVSGATLASVPPFDSTQQRWEAPKPYDDTQLTPQPPVSTQQQQNLLQEASLVFVRKTEQAGRDSTASTTDNDDNTPRLNLTPGTRIQARLETQISSAITAPVVAVVDYTYSLGDHVVIPAGARVYGQLQQADRSGAVSIKFNEIELLDGNREKIDAIGTNLEMGPIEGSVSGKNAGRNFLVRTASGIGSVAAMVVGTNTSSSFSEDDLIRQRIAQNVGNAGDTEIMNMALTNRIMVSVSADTPIFIVFTKREPASTSSRNTLATTPHSR